MADITNIRWIYTKGFLFLFAGILAAGLLLFECPTFKTGGLLALCVWCFTRFYYFVFYVIQHYVDDEYRFAGLWSFARYMMGARRRGRSWSDHD